MKKTIHFGPPLGAVLEGLRPNDTISGRLNTVAERYTAILAAHGIDLDEEETLILGNCLSGSWVDPLFVQCLADEIADSEFAGTRGADSLIAKLKAAPFADLVATVEKLGF